MEVLDHFYRPEVAEAGRLCGRPGVARQAWMEDPRAYQQFHGG